MTVLREALVVMGVLVTLLLVGLLALSVAVSGLDKRELAEPQVTSSPPSREPETPRQVPTAEDLAELRAGGVATKYLEVTFNATSWVEHEMVGLGRVRECLEGWECGGPYPGDHIDYAINHLAGRVDFTAKAIETAVHYIRDSSRWSTMDLLQKRGFTEQEIDSAILRLESDGVSWQDNATGYARSLALESVYQDAEPDFTDIEFLLESRGFTHEQVQEAGQVARREAVATTDGGAAVER